MAPRGAFALCVSVVALCSVDSPARSRTTALAAKNTSPNATTQATTASVNAGAESMGVRGRASLRSIAGERARVAPVFGVAPAMDTTGSSSPQLPQNLPPGVGTVPHWGQNIASTSCRRLKQNPGPVGQRDL